MLKGNSTMALLFIWMFALSAPTAFCDDRTQDDVKSVADAKSILPIIQKKCMRCHGAEEQNSGIRFDRLDPESLDEAMHGSIVLAREAIESGSMPPEDEPQLTDVEREQLLEWMSLSLEKYAARRRKVNGAVTIRRLTRREYEYTLQDLFGATASFSRRLPPDPISETGYDNSSELLMVSHVDLQLYLDAAKVALERYLHFGETNKTVQQFAFEVEGIYHYCRGPKSNRATLEQAPGPLGKFEFREWQMDRQSKPVVYRDRQYGPLPYGNIPTGDVPEVGEGRGFARLHEQFIHIKTRQRVGNVNVRIHAAATRSVDGSVPRMRLEAGRRYDRSLKTLRVGETDVMAPPESPGVYEFSFRMEDALPLYPGSKEDRDIRHLLLVISNVARHEAGELAGSEFGHADLAAEGRKFRGATARQTRTARKHGRQAMERWSKAGVSFLKLDAVELEIVPVGAERGTRWAMPLPDSEQSEVQLAQAALARFLPKAFRRPVTDAEIRQKLKQFMQLRANGESYQGALKGTLASALISPSFLFIGYPMDESDRARDLAFASQLSYFLWSSMPDEQLVEMASKGELRDTKTLAIEVRRMLDDPKSRRLSSAFARQWMKLRQLENVIVDERDYPDFGSEFRQLIERQSVETFQENFHNERDARALFSSDHMLLNDQLARHYGIQNVRGGDLRLVAVDEAKHWGGLLTHASILTMNSDGRDSHPVKRGVWMLERILDDPPPPPPPLVPELDSDNPAFDSLSLKQKIELHRKTNGCTNCHAKIDPWGIAFESYDATGRWRNPDTHSKPIDSTTVLPDGKAVSGARELSAYLLGEREQDLMRSLVRHMMLFAIGRELDIVDEPDVEQVFEQFRDSGYRLKSLASAIARSKTFKGFY